MKISLPFPAATILFLAFVFAFATCTDASVTNVTWYRLGENDPGAASGQVANSTTMDFVGTNHLKRFGSPLYTNLVSTDAAKLGSTLAVRFDGGSQFYSNAVATTARNNFGIEAWARTLTTNVGTYLIAHNGTTTANGWGLIAEVSSRFGVIDTTFRAEVGGGAPFGAGVVRGNWAHVALVRNNGISTFYLNGKASGSTTNSTPATPTRGFAIAATPQSPHDELFPGMIDEVRVFTFAPGQFSTNDLLVNQRRAVTLDASDITPTTARLNGSASSVTLPTAAWFEWGTTATNLENLTPPQALGSSFASTNFSEVLTGLTAGVYYYFRAASSNDLGMAFGGLKSFIIGPTVRFWTGNAGVEWSVGANWLPAQGAQAGDDLVFPGNAANLTSSNDIPGISINSLQIYAPMYLRGAAVTVSNGLSSATPSGLVTVECPIILGGDQEFSDDQFHLEFDGGINLNGHNLTFNAIGNNGAQIIVSSVISGTGNILKIGPGDMLWQGAGNTFFGTLRVENGNTFFGKSAGQNAVITRLEIAGPGRVQLDQSDQIFNLCPVQIETGGQFLLNGHKEFLTSVLTLWDDAVIDGGANYDPSSGGLYILSFVRVRTTNSIAVIRNGILGMNSTGVTFDVDGIKNSQQTGFLDVSANIIGVGFSKTGNGELRLSGTNSFNGTVVIQAGLVTAAQATAFGAADGGVELRGSGSLQLTNVNVAAETLTVFSDNFQEQEDSGQVTRGAAIFVTQTNSWGGPIILQTNLFLYAGAGDLTLSGPISGTGGLWLNYGSFHIEGTSTNSHSGGTYARCPLLTLNKSIANQAIAIPGPLSVGAFVSFPQVEVRWLNSRQAAPSNTLTLHTNAFVNLNRNSQDFGTIIFNGGRIDTGTSPGLLQVNQQIISNPTNITGRIDGFMRLLRALDITVADGPVDPDLVINAVISDGAPSSVGSINKRGDGELLLSAQNTSDGLNKVFNGILEVLHDNALGTSSTFSEVFDGATLQVENLSSSFVETLALHGTGRGGTNGALYSRNGCTIGAVLFLQEPSTIRVDSTSSSLFINQHIAGTGPLTKTGPGFLTFGSSLANTYTGETFVNDGRLTLQKPDGVTAIPSHLTIGPAGIGSSANVVQMASFAIIGSVTVNPGALWNLNNFSEGFTTSALEGRLPLTLNGGGDVQTGTGFLFLPVGGDVLVAPLNFVNAISTISGNLGLDPGAHRFTVGTAHDLSLGGIPELDISAVISQTSSAADIIKDGPGEMRLDRANTFTGAVTVNDGTLTVTNNSSLGTSAGGTTVNGNGSLALDGNGLFISNEVLTMNSSNASALHVVSSTNTWFGPIALNRDTAIDVSPPFGNLQAPGIVSGPGGLTKRGPGALVFSGSGLNNYGSTIVAEGVLIAQRTSGPSLPGDVLVAGAGQLATLSSGQFSSSSRVTLQSGGFWSLNSSDAETIRTLAGGGSVAFPSFTSTATLTINNNISCEFSGSFSGSSGQLVKDGNATLLLSGNSSGFSGTTTVVRGECRVDGNMISSPFILRSPGRLSGDGIIGNLTSADNGAVIAPSSKFPDHQGGDIEAGNLDFSTPNFAACMLQLEFFGPSSIGGNDKIIARGNVTLGKAFLFPSFQYAPREGDVINLIEKLSAGAISGTFLGMPQDSLINVNGITCRVSYTGGTGNDVTLTVTNLPLALNGAFVSSGNGNASLESDECVLLQVALRNKRATTLTLSNVQLRASFPQLLVTSAESVYAPLPAFGIASGSPFQIRTTSSFPCGTPVPMELQVTVPGEGTFAIPFTIPGSANCGTPGGGACESCTVVTAHFDTNGPTTLQPLNFVGGPSLCFPTKACPGIDPATNLPPTTYATHSFTNSSTNLLCVTANVKLNCEVALGPPAIAAYLNTFDTNNVCANYLGDSGGGLGFPFQPFSFLVPAGSNFVLVVTRLTSGCLDYTLELFDLPCPPPTIAIGPVGGSGQALGAAFTPLSPDGRGTGVVSSIQLNWSTAYPEWTVQQAAEVTGAFSDLLATPMVVNGRYALTNMPATTNQFYRLKR